MDLPPPADEAPFCPGCRYPLRGLWSETQRQVTCPECGAAHEIPGVAEASDRIQAEVQAAEGTTLRNYGVSVMLGAFAAGLFAFAIQFEGLRGWAALVGLATFLLAIGQCIVYAIAAVRVVRRRRRLLRACGWFEIATHDNTWSAVMEGLGWFIGMVLLHGMAAILAGLIGAGIGSMF